MKKVLAGIMLSGMVASALMASNDGFGVEVGTKVASGSDEKVLGIQNISELVGDGGQEIFIEPTYKAGWAQVGLRFSNNSTDDENKAELTWKLNLSEKSDSNLKYFINGGFGFGVQGGKTATISTNITKPEYVTATDLSVYQTPSQATIDDSTFVSFSIGFGASYEFTKNLKVNAGYEFERKSWDISYTVAGKETQPIDLSGVGQNFHGVRASVEYRF